MLSGRASDLRKKVLELAKEVLFVFEKRLHLHIDLFNDNERLFSAEQKQEWFLSVRGIRKYTHIVHHPLLSLLISYGVLQRVLLLLSVCLQNL